MKNSLSYQAFLLTAAKAADAFTLLVLGMILARVLTLEDYGTYRQVWLLYYTLIPLFTLGIATSVNYFVPRFEPGQQKTFIFQTYSGLFILGFLFAVFLYTGADFFGSRFNNPALGQVIKIFSLVPLLTMPTSYYHNLYICLKSRRRGRHPDFGNPGQVRRNCCFHIYPAFLEKYFYGSVDLLCSGIHCPFAVDLPSL